MRRSVLHSAAIVLAALLLPSATHAQLTCSLESGIDYYGNDLRTVEKVDLTGCCSACNSEPTCQVFTYVAATSSCYLKTSAAGRTAASGVVSGKKAAISVPATCGASVDADVDYYGNDIRMVNGVDLAGCCSACNNEASCGAYTYWGSSKTCYLKTKNGGSSVAVGAVSGKKIVVSIPPTCGASVDRDVDYYGNDIRQVNGVDLAGCCSACNNEASCGAYTYWASSQTCYLKTKNGGSSVAVGAVSGYKVATSVPATCGASVDKDVDYYGNDIRMVNGVDLAGCCSACNNEASCGAYTYWGSSKTCYLKTKNGGSSVAVGAISGKKVSTALPPTCAAGIETNIDYYGNDIKTVNGVDLGGCCSACNNEATCNVYTYVASSQSCYLKTKNTGRVTSIGAVSGQKLSSIPATCAAGIENDVDYYGNDIKTVNGVSLGGCCTACNNEATCNVYTYVASSQSCYLKTKNSGRVTSIGAVSGTKRQVPTGDWDTARCGSKKLSIYYHGNDIVGSEKAFDTVEECCDYCRSNSNCKLFTYFRRGSQKRCLLKTGAQVAEKTRYEDRDGLYVASGLFA